MWFTFESITEEKGLKSEKTGKTYDAWILKGIKKGFDGEKDEPYEKMFFGNSTTTIVEFGMERPNCGIVEFFLKGVNPGETVILRNVRVGKNWEVMAIERTGKRSDGSLAPYEPLKPGDVSSIQEAEESFEKGKPAPEGSIPPWAHEGV